MPPIEGHPSLEILKELTDRLIKRDADILKKVRQLSVLVEIQKILLQNNDPEIFHKIIDMLSGISRASRIYLYKNTGVGDNAGMSLSYEWQAPDILPFKIAEEYCTYKNLPVFNLYMNSNQPFHFRVRDLPTTEHQVFTDNGVKVTLRVPIYVKSTPWGFFGLDNCEDDILWNEEDLNIIFNVVSSIELYLKNKHTEEDLQNSTSLFSEVWENSSDPILLLTEEEQIVKVNKSFYNVFPVTYEKVIGKYLGDFHALVQSFANNKEFTEVKGISTINDKKFILVILKTIEKG